MASGRRAWELVLGLTAVEMERLKGEYVSFPTNRIQAGDLRNKRQKCL
jgi:hypothetical protein